MTSYISNVIVLWAIFSAAALSLRSFSGESGYLSLMHAVFFGVGAYVAALLPNHINVPVPFVWMAAAGVGGVVAFVITTPLFRAKADYFAVLTIAMQLAANTLFRNAESLTGGAMGVSVPAGWAVDSVIAGQLLIAMGLLLVTWVLVTLMEKTKSYRILVALRSGEHLLLSFGYNVATIRAIQFSYSAAITAVCGSVFAQYIGYIDPSSFRLEESIFIMTVVILAGMRGRLSVLLAGMFVVSVPEALRFIPFDSSVQANIKQMVYALGLCGAILVRYKRSAPSYS